MPLSTLPVVPPEQLWHTEEWQLKPQTQTRIPVLTLCGACSLAMACARTVAIVAALWQNVLGRVATDVEGLQNASPKMQGFLFAQVSKLGVEATDPELEIQVRQSADLAAQELAQAGADEPIESQKSQPSSPNSFVPLKPYILSRSRQHVLEGLL